MSSEIWQAFDVRHGLEMVQQPFEQSIGATGGACHRRKLMAMEPAGKFGGSPVLLVRTFEIFQIKKRAVNQTG